ncbi:hypothetical protein DFQ26_001858 [Actinomortierella ambigua]|nr:hypothetical protein DFQ26_001858 [Actinomortierella ambigua]
MRLFKVQVLLCAASAAMALAQHVIVSKAVFSGKDTTRWDDTGADIYKHLDNFPSAAAALVVQAAQKSQYEPYSRNVLKGLYPYQSFETKMRRFPGFRFSESRGQIDIKSSDRGDLYEAVKSAYSGVENKIIAATIRNLVPTKNPVGRDSRFWLLSVPVIRRDTSGTVTIKLARLTLHLFTDEDNNVEIVADQKANFVVSEYELKADYLNDHAETLAVKVPSADIDGFKLYFTSKSGDGSSASHHHSDVDSDDLWFHLESQTPLLERLRKAWNDMWLI